MRDDTVSLPPAELLVCVKCRRGQEIPEDEQRPGAHLFEALQARGLPDGVRLSPVECLQNCDHGCTIAFRGGPHRWTYVYANLHEASQPDLVVESAALYHAARDGLIPWRQRPEHLKRNCVARIPPEEPLND